MPGTWKGYPTDFLYFFQKKHVLLKKMPRRATDESWTRGRPKMDLIPFPKSEHVITFAGSAKPRLVLLACGSYSPIHNQHLRNFEDARNALSDEFDVIQGIGTRQRILAAHSMQVGTTQC